MFEDSRLHVPLEGHEATSAEGAGCSESHPSEASAIRVATFMSEGSLVVGGKEASAQNAVGELQQSSETIECATQTTDDLLPRKQSDLKNINRMRVQMFRKADAIRRVQRENSRLKKKLSGMKRYIMSTCLTRLPSLHNNFTDAYLRQ